MPKHLQFAQINKKFQSDVNKKLIVQRSELIVSREKNNLRIEPKQLRKTIIVRVLSLRSSVIHGFVTEPWYSRHVRVSCERAASSVLSHLRALFHVGAWCSDPGTHVLCEFRFCVGVRTFALVFCVPCALMSICLDPIHLVTCLLINFPQLLSLITLLICSLYNLLVFAVPCWFVVV